MLANSRFLSAGRAAGRVLDRVGLRPRTDLGEILRGHASLSDGEARAAFIHTLRAIIDPRGQRVDASDRLYLAEQIPFLVIWGDRDPVIPVAHALAVRDHVPGTRVEIFPGAGHFPHLDDPQRFVHVVVEFVASTEPAALDSEHLRRALRAR